MSSLDRVSLNLSINAGELVICMSQSEEFCTELFG